MLRIGLAVVLVVSLFVPFALETQQAGTVYRIGYLSPGRRDQVAHIWDAFEGALRDLGYVEAGTSCSSVDLLTGSLSNCLNSLPSWCGSSST